MTRWWRRNRWALVVIVVMVVVIGLTVTYQSWQTERGYLTPHASTRIGSAIEFEGVQWRLEPVRDPVGVYHPQPPPEHSRLQIFVMYRTRGEAPAALPDTFSNCLTAAVAGPRRWTQPVTFDYRYALQHGFVSECADPGPLLVGRYVPDDVDIDAIDVMLLPQGAERAPGPSSSPTDQSAVGDTDTATSDDDEALYSEPTRSPVVLRFTLQ